MRPFTPDIIRAAFDGLSPMSKAALVAEKTKLLDVLKEINKSSAQLSPHPTEIFNAFRYCPLENAKVIMLGLGPNPSPDFAHGLAYSAKSVPVEQIVSLNDDHVVRYHIPEITAAIFKCLHAHGLMPYTPTQPKLIEWARQGVLLLDIALTTEAGKPSAHIDLWKSYMQSLLAIIARTRHDLVWITFGTRIKDMVTPIRPQHMLWWGHPSPNNPENKPDNPRAFINCDVFEKANAILVSQNKAPIDWSSVAVGAAPLSLDNITTDNQPTNDGTGSQPVVAPNMIQPTGGQITIQPAVADTRVNQQGIQWVHKTIVNNQPNDRYYLFTDGGALGNGKRNCTATYAWLIVMGDRYCFDTGRVPEANLGEKYNASNNRGELLGIKLGLECLATSLGADTTPITIVTDSEYAIGCLDKWYASWLRDAKKMKDKKNIDLIDPAYTILQQIKKLRRVAFRHVKSHRSKPTDPYDQFLWTGNDIVDRLCSGTLKPAELM